MMRGDEEFFQFQYGTIKRDKFAVGVQFNPDFQFQYGTIKSRSYQWFFDLSSYNFQFQYGTIKSAPDGCMWSVWLLFQFQYGTIKSQAQKNQTFLIPLSIPVWYD